MWTVDAAALERIAIGAGILGTGGGGNPYLGLLHARLMVEAHGPVAVVDPDEVPDDALVVSVGGMGAPIVSIERIRQGDEELNALRALEAHLGRRCTLLVPGEIGGANALRPLALAARIGLPVVDGDAMGRAFPELQMETFAIHGVRPTPAALADPRGHVALFDRIADAETLERYARAVTIQMGGAAGYAFPPLTGAELKRTVIPRTLTLADGIGAAVLAARARHADPVAAVLAVAGGQRLFAGKIVDVDRRLEGGFARGTLRLDGLAADAGRALRVDFQNENLIARADDGEVLAVVPDLICLVDADTAEPVTTEVLRYGLRVLVLGIPAPAQLKTPEALAVVGPAAFGYPDVPYVPLRGVYGDAAAS
ncbi:MAG: DUF917 domain-containing protein [Chloroflexota bacterium]|nr:DUF917 domain-containing protein [Chloroflexota bacterium]